MENNKVKILIDKEITHLEDLFIINVNSLTGEDTSIFQSGDTTETLDGAIKLIQSINAPAFEINITGNSSISEEYILYNKTIKFIINGTYTVTLDDKLSFNNCNIYWVGDNTSIIYNNNGLDYKTCFVNYYAVKLISSLLHTLYNTRCEIGLFQMEHISDTGFSIKGYCEFIITNNCTITPNSDMNNLVFIKANDWATGIIRITRFKVLTLVNSTYVYKLTPDNVSPITDIYNAGTLNIPEQPSPTGRKIWDLPLIAYTDNTAARSAGKLNGNIYINSITNALSIVVP